MVVIAPPITVDNPKGMSTRDGATLALSVTPTSSGSMMTTIGVLLTTALSTAAITMVPSIEATGAMLPEPRQHPRHRPQRRSGLEALAEDHQRANRNERLVAETGEQVGRLHRAVLALVREQAQSQAPEA